MRLTKFGLLILTIFCSCDSENEGEPVNYPFFFQLRSPDISENNEFFSVHPSYDYSKLILRNIDGSTISNSFESNTDNDLNEDQLKGKAYLNDFIVSNKLIIATPTPYQFLLDFDNGDIDTLEISSDPFVRYFNSKVVSVKIKYNGKEVIDYPFGTNYSEFMDRNSWRHYEDYTASNPYDPIIFQIQKK